MKLSIIIPVYRVEKYIDRTLSSCFTQSGVRAGISSLPNAEYEVVVVNDGTPDRSMDIVRRYAANHPNLRIIEQENRGLSAARNTGLRAAAGEYLWFVDSDDWVSPDALSKVFPYLDGENDEVVFGATNVTDDGKQALSDINSFPAHHQKCYSGVECWRKGLQQISTSVLAIYRKDFLMAHQLLFKEGYIHEDVEFCPKASYLSRKTVFLHESLYFVRQNPASLTRSLNPKGSYDYIKLCHYLKDFMEKEVCEPDIKRIFHRLISLEINEAFRQILKCDKGEIVRFNQFCRQHQKEIFGSLRKSWQPKNMLEWGIFLFTSRYANVYQFLVKWKPKK